MTQATLKKSKPSLGQIVADFPRKHLIIASVLITLLFVGLLLAPTQTDKDSRTSKAIELKLEAIVTPIDTIKETIESPWSEIEVRAGDNLSIIFQRASLPATEVYNIISNSNDSKGLLRLHPGQKIALRVDTEGKLESLRHIKNKFESTLFERDGDKFNTQQIKRQPEIRQNYSSATISNSLFMAAQNTGLSQNLIMELANIFGGVIDFVYDVRNGDNFTILYEEHFLDDEKTSNGPILAAQFTNRGETYTAYRYQHPGGSIGYYNEDGVSMRKAFLRAPLDFTRISSGFNLKRLHPVFKTTKPHRGIDYAASRGTPVYAAGDGRVSKAGYTKANGNYVFINHGQNYTTKYLHLQKRGVRANQKVKQQQIIGWVGSTGYATGPHLHYEFLVNGVHRNPRTILKKLPKAKSILAKNKDLFLAQISSLQMQLTAYNNQLSIAKAEQLTDNNTL